MTRRNWLPTLLPVLVLMILALPAAAQDETPEARADGRKTGALQPLSTIMDRMQSLWQTYQSPSMNRERGEIIAEQIVQLRHRAGMRSFSSLARAFAMRGWREIQEGRLLAALDAMQVAVRLDPYSREMRSGLASALAARDPINIFEYLPVHIDSFAASFGTEEGRYQLLADISQLLGVSLLIFAILWGVAMLWRHLPALHHTISELLAVFFRHDLSGILAAMVLVSPIVFGVEFIWLVLFLVAATWGFQSGAEKGITVGGVILGLCGAGLIFLSSTMAVGLTDPLTQAGFAAERLDSNYAMVNTLEKALTETGALGQGVISDSLTDTQRRDLFLYAIGKRKLGQEQAAGIDLLAMFDRLAAMSDDLGMRARVNAANMRYERGDIRGAMLAYEGCLVSRAAEPFALYNLWRLNYYSLGNLDVAEELMGRLRGSFPDFVRNFSIENLDYQPELIDAGLSRQEVQSMIGMGLARAIGASGGPVDPAGIFATFVSDNQRGVMLAGALGLMLVSHFVLGMFGFAVPCKDCGKVFCHSCDIDPKSSRSCQACNSVKALKKAVDAELRRDQMKKIEVHGKRRTWETLIANLVVPGLGTVARSGWFWVGAGLLLLFSLTAGFAYSLDRMPRTEALPYFSHWNLLTILVFTVMCAAAWITGLILALRAKRGQGHGTLRKS